MNNQTGNLFENTDDYLKIKVLDSFKGIKMRSIENDQIIQSNNNNELNFTSLSYNQFNNINKKKISNKIEINKNIYQSPPLEPIKNNLLSKEKILSRNYISMKSLSKTKKGLLRQTSPEHDLILSNLKFNDFSKSIKSKRNDIF